MLQQVVLRALPVLAVLLLVGSVGLLRPAAVQADAPPSSGAGRPAEGLEGQGPAAGGYPYYYAPGPVGGPEDLPLVGPILGGFSSVGAVVSKVGECLVDLPLCFLETLVGALKLMFTPFIQLVEFTLGDLLAETGKSITVDAPFVRDLMGLSRAIALGLMAVVLMWGGLAIMAGRHLGSPYHELAELLPRVAAAVALIAIFPWLAGFLIDVNNALVRAVIHPEMIKQTVSQLISDLGAVPTILFWAAFLVLGVFLAGQLLMRFVILDLLLVTAPIAIMLWVLPQTRRWSELWADLFPATIFQQALQAWTLVLGFRIVSAVWAGAGGFVAPGLGSTILAGLAAIAVLLAALKIPDLLSRAIGYWQPGWSPVLATFNLGRSLLAGGGRAAAGGRVG